MTNIVSLDLELNQAGNPKIIQIGTCIAELETKKIIEKRSFLVNPNEAITEFITKLTGISDEDVKEELDDPGRLVQVVFEDAVEGAKAVPDTDLLSPQRRYGRDKTPPSHRYAAVAGQPWP